MASPSTDYGQLLSKTWQAIIQKDNVVPLLIGAVVLTFASGLTIGILAGPLVLGYVASCLKIARGEPVAIEDLWTGFSRLVPSIITLLILIIGVVVGTVLCVVPGLVVGVLGFFTFHVMVDDVEASGMDAIKKSAAIVKANLTDVVVVVIIGALLNAVLSVSVVGVIAGAAFVSLMSAFLYDEIKQREGGEAAGTAL